ncbi:MAG: RDD family protein [Bdellovibrionia bacterium]
MKWRLPTLGDRLAAVIIDFGILGLVSSLLLAPVTRQIYITKHIGDKSEIALLYLLSIFLFVLIGILYQTFFVWKQGCTPGQRAFRIRVVNLWDGEQPGLMTALTRAIFWWVDTMLCGFPHLAVFSNTQRRPMHDRLADTIVTTIGKQTSQPAPGNHWVTAGKIAVVFAFVGCIFVFGFELLGKYQQIEALESWQDELANLGGEECADVSDAKETWPEDVSRLAVAMALFSAEVVGSECLELEAYRAFKLNEELDLAYLTRAFSRNEDADLSDAYLKKVCEVSKPDNETCVFSQLIESWTEKNWDAATEIFDSILPKSRAYVKIWAIKHFERTKQFDRELQLIEQLGARRALAGFLGTHRAVSLWGLHRRDEARAALAATMENMEVQDRVNLASWFCYRELLDDCGSVHHASCSSFAEGIDDNQEILAQSGVAVTMLRYEECRPGHTVNYKELADMVPGDDAADLLKASEMVKAGKSKVAAEVLKELSSPERDRVYAADAQMRLVTILNSEQEMGEVIEAWKGMDHSVWEWRRLGRSIFDRFMALGLNSQAFALGQQILEADPLDKSLFKDVVVAGYRAGLKSEAWSMLSEQTARAPASATEGFPQVETMLKEEFNVQPKTLPPKESRDK